MSSRDRGQPWDYGYGRVYVGDGLPEGTVLLADKADLLKTTGQTPAAARGRVSGRISPQDVVGISLFHTVGDRERALEQIGTGFSSLQDEVMKAAGYSADPYRAASGPIYDWWKTAGIPTIEEWQRFRAIQSSSWGSRFAASWEIYETWQKRLEALRQAASQRVHLASPPPPPLPTTLPGDVVDATGGAIKAVASTAWNIGRFALWGGAILGGAYVGVSIFNMAKGRKTRIG